MFMNGDDYFGRARLSLGYIHENGDPYNQPPQPLNLVGLDF